MRQTSRRAGRISAMLLVSFGLAGLSGFAQEKPAETLTPDRLAALDRISAKSLEGHLSFLASDLLEGRDSPSRGLDLAAEYIAAQFRRAGLEPVGDDRYFQTASWDLSESDPSTFSFEIVGKDGATRLGRDDLSLTGARTFEVWNAPLFKLDFKTYKDLKPENVEGKAIVVELPDLRKVERADRMALQLAIRAFRAWTATAKVALVLTISRDPDAATGPNNRLLIDPQEPEGAGRRNRNDPASRIPAFAIHDPEVVKGLDAKPFGPLDEKVSTSIGEPVKRPVKLRNVVGLLRGSDPALKETYVMVTAHYDHVGLRGRAGTDRIYNGANDDGSGTVSVVELAASLGTLKGRPRRSILFVTFFGEEKGLLGSSYYGRHPVVPVEKTIADVNLEQVGRTDSTEGPQAGRASLTGFGYSGVSTAFTQAGLAEGVEVYKHPRNSDAYFEASDNQALADLGVPAHTLCVAFDYADYHGAADHWDKVDYANMARVDRLVARALLTLADSPDEPKWDEANPKAAKFLKAWKARRRVEDKAAPATKVP